MSATPSELELLARRNDRMMDKAVAIYRRRLQGLQQRIMEEIRASRLPDSRLAISLNSYQAIEQMLARAGFSTFYEFQDLLEESALESVSQLSDAIGDPDILVLDEPTAALDGATERSFLDVLPTRLRSRTVFVVAHRLSTVQNADRTLLLDQRRLVATGTHRELLEGNDYYRSLVVSQQIISAGPV